MAKPVKRIMDKKAWDVAEIIALEMNVTVMGVTGNYGNPQERLAKDIFIYSLKVDLEIPTLTVEKWMGIAGSRQRAIMRTLNEKAENNLGFNDLMGRIEEAITRKRQEWENE